MVVVELVYCVAVISTILMVYFKRKKDEELYIRGVYEELIERCREDEVPFSTLVMVKKIVRDEEDV